MYRFFFIIFLCCKAMTFAQNPGPQELEGVGNFIKSFEAAWNTHNSQALSSLWAQDGDLITPWGRWIMGPAQIEKHFEKEKLGPFGKSQIFMSIDSSRAFNPQAIVMDVTIRLQNIVDPKNEWPPSLLQHGTFLLVKNKDQWKIVSARIYQFQHASMN